MSQKANQTRNRPGWRAKSVRIGQGQSLIEEGINFNPWQSIYKANYTSRRSPIVRPKGLHVSHEMMNLPKIKQAENKVASVKTCATPVARLGEANKENCNNSQGFFLKNKFAKSSMKNPKANDDSEDKANNSKPKLFVRIKTEASPRITNGKSAGRSFMELNDSHLQSRYLPVTNEPSRKSFTGSRVDRDTSQTIEFQQSNLQVKPINFSKLKRRKLQAPNMINPIGQNETWIDPADEKAPVVHSQMIHLNTDNFLDSNVKNLIAAKNEYYPIFTGKCLCGECVCGTCKCVHFKINTNDLQNRKPDQTNYQSDYIGTSGEPIKTVKIPSELQRFNTKMSLPTTYRDSLCKKPAHLVDSVPFINRAKETNVGPGDCGIKGPMNKESQYRNDYPDWKCAHPEIIPPMFPETFVKNFPMRVKTFNQEYGSFDPSEADKPERAPNKLHQKTS